jgi:hypothetical protein
MANKKSGYDYLKEKAANLEKRNGELVARLLQVNLALAETGSQLRMCKQMRDYMGERYVWLYAHAPWWLKLWFKRSFKDSTK